MSLEKRVRNRIPKQRKSGKLPGGAKTMFQRTRFPISMVNFVLLFITAYYTTIRHVTPWLPLWGFFIILIVCIGVYVVIDYIYFYPSEIEFKKEEQYKKDPIVSDIRLIERRIRNIEKKLGTEEEEKNCEEVENDYFT